jgi:perosamine synthetase
MVGPGWLVRDGGEVPGVQRVAVTVVGGAGFVGSAVGRRAATSNRPVVSLDRVRQPPPRLPAAIEQRVVDLLVDPIELPPGLVVLAAGGSDPHAGDRWRLALDNAVTTARLVPALADRQVVLVSSAEVRGPAGGELPIDDDAIADWCAQLRDAARRPCPPWQAAALCRELVAADPSGRWAYALAKRAQELLVRSVVEPDRLTVLRAANLFGPGQDRVVAQLARRALAGLPLAVTDTVRTFLPVDDLAAVALDAVPGTLDAGLAALPLTELAGLVLDTLAVDVPVTVDPPPRVDVSGRLDTAEFRQRLGVDDGRERLDRELRSFVAGLRDDRLPAFSPPLSVVLPPRPRRPDRVAARIQACLETGSVKGGRWTGELAGRLRGELALPDDSALLLTASGSAALRLAVQAIAGPARPDDVAVVPSFTFAATGEILVQLGYTLRFCDVRPDTWTMDPDSLAAVLADGEAAVVVAVDALGAPADYTALTKVCADAGVPLVADSAAALGAWHQGRPVALQAAAHAYSLSFAKVVSAGGSGGALVLPAGAVERLRSPVDWLRSVPMVETAAVAALDLLDDLDLLVGRRRAVAARYAQLAVADGVRPQQVADGDAHAFVHWVARFGGVDRDRLVAELDRLGIGTKPYYAPPLHWHDWGPYAERAGPLPVSDALGREALALPMSSELSPLDAERVTMAVLAALTAARR